MKDTSAWSNKREALEQEQTALQGVEAGLAELDEQGIAARIATAAAARDEAQADFARHAAKPSSCDALCLRQEFWAQSFSQSTKTLHVLRRATAAVEAAQREVAGAEAGDGRDESNRTLQERLADAQNAQVRADRSCCSAPCSRQCHNNACGLQMSRPKVHGRCNFGSSGMLSADHG